MRQIAEPRLGYGADTQAARNRPDRETGSERANSDRHLRRDPSHRSHDVKGAVVAAPTPACALPTVSARRRTFDASRLVLQPIPMTGRGGRPPQLNGWDWSGAGETGPRWRPVLFLILAALPVTTGGLGTSTTRPRGAHA